MFQMRIVFVLEGSKVILSEEHWGRRYEVKGKCSLLGFVGQKYAKGRLASDTKQRNPEKLRNKRLPLAPDKIWVSHRRAVGPTPSFGEDDLSFPSKVLESFAAARDTKVVSFP